MENFSQQLLMRRRQFLQIGGWGLGSIALPLFAARDALARAESPVTGKSVIFLFQQGGPPQHETFDPKVDVPSEIASVGGDIATSVPGVRFGESLAKLAGHHFWLLRHKTL